MSTTAEELEQIAQAHIGAGIAPHGKTPEISGALAVGSAAVLDLVQRRQIFRIIRLHADSTSDMLQRGDLVAQAVIGQSAEIIPPGIALVGVLQGVQCLAVAAEADVLEGRLLVGISLGTPCKRDYECDGICTRRMYSNWYEKTIRYCDRQQCTSV